MHQNNLQIQTFDTMAKKTKAAVQPAVEQEQTYAASASVEEVAHVCKNCFFHREHNGICRCTYEYTPTKTIRNTEDDMTCAAFCTKQEDARCCANCRYACFVDEEKTLINCAFRADVKGNPAYKDWCCRMFERAIK